MDYVLKSQKNKCFYILENNEIISEIHFGDVFKNMMNVLDAISSREIFIHTDVGCFDVLKGTELCNLDTYDDLWIKGKMYYLEPYLKNMQNELYDYMLNQERSKAAEVYNEFRFLPLFVCDSRFSSEDFKKFKSNSKDLSIVNDIISDRLHYIGPHFYNGDMCEIWAYKEYFDLFVLDFWEVLTHKDVHAKICKHCKRVFYPTSGRIKFCDQCKKIYGHIRYKTRIVTERQALEKKILNYAYIKFSSDKNMHGANEWTFNFLQESNYYRSVISGDDVEVNPDYRSDIKTMNDYISWLESTLEFVKSYKKETSDKNGR